MKIKFVIDIGEHLEGDVVDLPKEIAEQHIEAGHAVEEGKKESKKDK